MREAALLKKPEVKKEALPLHDRVLIRPVEEAEQGMIAIPDTAKERGNIGVVVAVGPGRFDGGKRIPIDLRKGDVVMYTKFGMDVKVNGEKLVLVVASEVYMKYTDDLPLAYV